MKKQIFFALIILSSFVACNGRSPYDYNEYIINKEQALAAADDKTDTEINNYITAHRDDSIANAGAEMEKTAASHLSEIMNEKAPDANGGQKYKDAVVKYFQLMKDKYTSYKNYGLAKTSEAKAAELGKLQIILDQKDKARENMIAAQEEFALANNFNSQK